MADENSRFDVEVKLTVTDRSTGEVVPEYSDVILHQYNNTYEKMQGFQSTICGVVFGALKAVGDEIAEEIKGKRGQKK